MIETELINYYKKLDINEKRNQISSELEKLLLLLDSTHKQLNIEKMPSAINFYNQSLDDGKSDSDYYDDIYQNIIYLRKDVLTLIKFVIESRENN